MKTSINSPLANLVYSMNVGQFVIMCMYLLIYISAYTFFSDHCNI